MFGLLIPLPRPREWARVCCYRRLYVANDAGVVDDSDGFDSVVADVAVVDIVVGEDDAVVVDIPVTKV